MLKSDLKCSVSGTPLEHVFVDLGESPLSNSLLRPEQLSKPEPVFPLCTYVSGESWLVQLPAHTGREAIFNADYPYFSSVSSTWLEHCQRYAENVSKRLNLGPTSLVLEVASNDGYLLQYFKAQGIPVLGVEPSASVAQVAEERGISTRVDFFGKKLASELVSQGLHPDLIAANNVFAHVPDLHDFVEGFRILLKPGGTLTLEFPHLQNLLDECQFDTIYHEHFSYFSLHSASRILESHQLRVVDLEQVPTHGGSLRLYVQHSQAAPVPSEAVRECLAQEVKAGLQDLATYQGFQARVDLVRAQFLGFLAECRQQGKLVVGYGAPAKGNTLLNYCKVSTDLLPWTVDKSPHKQGLFLPGSRLPIYAPSKILEAKPDFVVMLPWNLKKEIMQEMAEVRSWGGKFVTAIPQLTVLA